MRKLPCLLSVAALVMAAPALAQSVIPDLILTNGKFLTVDEGNSTAEAIAIDDDRITAVGSASKISALAGQNTRIVDLGGRTVIPGLIDSHIHVLRDGLTFGTRLDWSTVKSAEDALHTIEEAAEHSEPGSWIIVTGGWHQNQFAEKRALTPAELQKAAPDHPVYVQHLYDFATLNSQAMEKLQISGDTKIEPAGKVVVQDGGGIIEANGSVASLASVNSELPHPTFEEQVQGTRKLIAALNGLGITGVVDGGGSSFIPDQYQPFFELRRQGNLTLRVRYTLTSPTKGSELADVKALMRMTPAPWGDEWLKFNGPGEIVIWGMHDGSTTAETFEPDEKSKADLLEFATWAAEHRYPLQIHASQNSNAEQILDIFEQVNREHPINGLRWYILHVEDASDQTLDRMKALGIGFGVQDRLYFAGDEYSKIRSAEVLKRAPPIVTAMKKGLNVSGGTDALAISSYNPFVSLRWMLDGKTIAGLPTRDEKEIPSRLDALRMYTQNAAIMTFDENEKGSLEPGKLADLAVLSQDYTTVPVEDIGSITSELTIVGGKVVHAGAPFQELAPGQN